MIRESDPIARYESKQNAKQQLKNLQGQSSSTANGDCSIPFDERKMHQKQKANTTKGNEGLMAPMVFRPNREGLARILLK
ncbi:hypothetical protein [Prochlorococcus marinus]|uniref:Uncharacterized protein n=1 Tax=Prochlorococcus marinus (strain MIT 9303) TaxID=59922 RepID=A2CBS5_PROM3|nr:hypothetical protein [Prochlorococcus marinus]ABM78935.1 Hypothetical protein P9303_22001 [Prochlorococcus marinus str. MIT 9303]